MASIPTIARAIKQGRKNTESFFNDMTGVDDPASKGAARVLIRAIRKQLATKGPAASAPGAAPHKQSGRLARSIGQEVVGGVRRIGTGYFVGRLLQQGVDSETNVTPTGREFGTRRRKGGKARRHLTIAPRPFMEAALEAALPNMEGEAVGELQKREKSVRIPRFT